MKHRPGVVVVAAQSNDGATMFVEDVAQRVVATIKAPGLSDAQRRERYGRIFDHALDIRHIARVAIGHHLRAVNVAQKAQYFANFRRHIIDIYAYRFGGHDDARLEVLGEVHNAESETLVNARISGPRMASKDTVFRVRRTGGGFKIVDVTVDGVSLVLAKRSEFNSIVYNHGIEELLALLAAGHGRSPDPTNVFRAFLKMGRLVSPDTARVPVTESETGAKAETIEPATRDPLTTSPHAKLFGRLFQTVRN